MMMHLGPESNGMIFGAAYLCLCAVLAAVGLVAALVAVLS